MLWLIVLLTVILVLDCLFLLLLILVQLPKKEAGLGQAFGGGATDALFGAGSGNALTKMTKYATGVFLVLTLSISILNAHSKVKGSNLQMNMQKLGQQPSTSGGAATTGSNAATAPLVEQPLTNAVLTNLAPKPPTTTATNAAPPAASTGTNASTTEKPK